MAENTTIEWATQWTEKHCRCKITRADQRFVASDRLDSPQASFRRKERLMASAKGNHVARPGQTRAGNPNWRGGRVIASNGYVLIKVGFDHHLADVRGYAYEHRLVAEQKLGRRLEPGELVHHKDENKQNNHPDNLEVVASNAEHFVHHRKAGSNKQLPGEPNPEIECACGCGTRFPKYDESRRPRLYVSGHNPHQEGIQYWLLYYLENVPEPSSTQFIASFFDVDHRTITVAMSRLKRDGKVRGSFRDWRLVL